MIRTASMRNLRLRAPCALMFMLCAGVAQAAGQVTNGNDSGPGSLRDVASSGGLVTFQLGIASITLTSGPIAVPAGTTISGPGANSLRIDGNNSGRLFAVNAGAVTISGVTLTRGRVAFDDIGGAILNAGALTLDGVAVTGNSAGDAGGGVFNSGQLVVRNSLFSGNSVYDQLCAGGGAIRSQGAGSTLSITNSTVSANSAPSCSGGGISFSDGSGTITASTIAGNSAGASGGNVYKGGASAALTLTTSAVADGALDASAATPTNPDLHGAFGGGLTSGGNNLVETRGDGTGYVASDLADGTDPQLDALADHGGPTWTQLPQPASPLLERSGAPCQSQDQRGVSRPQGISCDIGAVEKRQFPLTAQVAGSGSVSANASPAPTIGSISGCTGTCVAYYDGEVQPTVTLVATPNPNQIFNGWIGACVGGLNPITTVAMTGAKTCIAQFVPATFTVTPSVGSAAGTGSIAPPDPVVVNNGATTVFTLTPAQNHHVASVGGTCGGTLSGQGNTTFTTAAISADCTVIANFAIDQHTVTPGVAGGNGSISPNVQVLVDHGSTRVFALAPAANYHVASVDGSCGGVLSGPGNTTFTTNAIVADCDVVAHFAIDRHTVTPSVQGGHGTIEPAAAVQVDHGATRAFALAPEANYHVAGVDSSCGGALSGPNNTVFTAGPVNADCTVVAHFAIDQHTVTPSVQGGHGAIDPPAAVQVDHGATRVFTLAPEANYHVAGVDGSCGGVLSGNGNTTYTTSAITADCDVVAHFAIDQYTLTSSVQGGHGTIDPAGEVQVDHGATRVFALAPDAHYHVAGVDGSCGGVLSGNGNVTYTTNAITAACDVVAHFAIDRHSVGGTVTGLVGSAMVLRLNGTQSLLVSANGAFTFPQPLDDLQGYAVSITQQPVNPAQVCTLANGSGTLGGSDVTDVLVTCSQPQPHLSLSVTDHREYTRYGMLQNYVVTLTNNGSGAASGITVASAPTPPLDAAATTWICAGNGGGASCAASGSGALDDANVSLPIGRSLTWVVSAPVRLDAVGGSVPYQVTVGGPASASASDIDTLVLFRTGMDVLHGDGAEGNGAPSPFACRVPGASSAPFDLTATRTLALPSVAGTAAIDSLAVARAANGAGFRIERLNLGDEPRVRIVVIDARGSERAGAWAKAQAGASLALAAVADTNASTLLVEGAGISLEAALPDGVTTATQVQPAAASCE